MRRILAAAAITLTTLSPSFAETHEERLALAEDYTAYALTLLDMEAMIRAMWEPVVAQAESTGQTVSEDQKAELDALYQATFTDPMMEIMRSQAPIMADIFTYEEISALNDFMHTDAGAAAMTKLPQLTAAQQPIIMEMVQSELPKVMPQLIGILSDN